MKSRSPSRSQSSSSQSSASQSSSQRQPRGNAAMQEEMGSGASEEGGSWWDSLTGAYDDVTGAVDDVSGAMDAVQSGAQAPVTAGINALGIDGLEAQNGAISYSNSALNFSESIDVPLGRLGPLSVGLFGTFSSGMQYSLRGAVEEGWFTNYATLDGKAHMDLDTSVGAKVALDVLVAEAGLRGALDLAGDLDGSIHLVVNFDENGMPTGLHEGNIEITGGATLGASAEVYIDTILTDEEAWELGSIDIGTVSGFGLSLSFDDSGLTDFDGWLGGEFTMSPELEAVVEDIKAKL